MIASNEPEPPIAADGLFVPSLPPVAERYPRWKWIWRWVGVEFLGNMLVLSGVTGFLLDYRDAWQFSAGGFFGATLVFTIAAMPQYAVIKYFLRRPARLPWYLAICCGYWLVLGFWWLRSQKYLTPFTPELLDITIVSIIMTFLHSLPPSIALSRVMPRAWLWAAAHEGGALLVVGVTLLLYAFVNPTLALGVYIFGAMFAYPLLTAWFFHEGMVRTYAIHG